MGAKPDRVNGKIVAGDVGGTNSRFALFDVRDGRVEILWQRTWPSRTHASLVEIASEARREIREPFLAATIGVAGPCVDGVCRATNLPWVVDAGEVARELGLESVTLLNDLEAHAWSISALGSGDFTVLQPGDEDARGNLALIAAGTGLGEAGLFWDGLEHRPFACEGGHTTFAPTNELELELSRALMARFGHASFERVLSGPGLLNVYEFLRDAGHARESPELAQALRTGDPAAAISKAAMLGTSVLASRTLELFVRIYGAEAGNLALKHMATGGVFIGGGIAPRIASWIDGPIFRAAFLGKGRMRGLLERIPVKLIRNDKTALIGAARHAQQQLSLA